jgi:hypothetical protein
MASLFINNLVIIKFDKGPSEDIKNAIKEAQKLLSASGINIKIARGGISRPTTAKTQAPVAKSQSQGK